MNKLGTKLGAIAMSAVMALTFAPSAAITSLAAGGDDLTDATQELSTPVYRLYNPNSGEHLFTTNENECDSLDKNGWDYETIAWYAPSTGDPVFRLYNPNHPLGDHHYTSSEEERDNLIKQGWKLDATAFNTVAEGELLGAPVYSLYNPNAYDLGMATHHLTLSEEEADGLELLGWTNEGPKFYEYAEDLDPEVEELTVSIDNTTPKVGDTLTATVTGAAVAEWEWTINGELYATSESITVPDGVKEGDEITVTVTAEDGETASDSVYVTGDLGLVSVESADGGYGAVLVAYFSEPVGDLQPGDIQIRRVSDDQLTTVENVIMASDGMTATLQLVGFAAGTPTTLTPNIDYNMTVITEEGSASKVFSIPAVRPNETVYKVNESKKTITTVSGTFFVPEEMDVDYEDILGRTVTFEFNKDMTLTKLNPKYETVVYSAFTVSNGGGADDAVLVDAITGEKYDDQETVAGTSDITPTRLIQRTTTGTATTPNFDFDSLANKSAYAYAKLVLNNNGTVKAMVTCPVWSNAAAVAQGNVLVTKTVGTSVYGGTTPVDLKDYLIVKDGQKIAIEDIEENDVVFFNSNFKYAEVYNSVETGELTAVYDGRFTFGGKTYNTTADANVPANLGYATRYIKTNGGMTAADNDYMNSLKAAGKDITVYFDRAGQPVFISGETAAVVTNDIQVVLTENAKLYKQSLVEYLRIKGFNGTEVKTYDIDISGLTKIVNATEVEYGKGHKPYPANANKATKEALDDPTGATGAAVSGGFRIAKTVAEGSTTFDPDKGEGTICQCDGTGALLAAGVGAIDGKNVIQTTATAGNGPMQTKSVVTLTTNDKGQVTAISYEDTTVAKNELKTGEVLKGGLSTVEIENGAAPIKYQIKASTPIYTYDDDANTVKKVDYSDFTAATQAGKSNKVHIYSMNETDVSWVVIESGALDTNSTGESTVEAVVSAVEYSADSDKKIVTISLVTADEADPVTYTKFGKDLKKDAVDLAVGDIVTVKIAADGATVNDAGITGGREAGAILAVTDVAKSEFTTIDADGTTTTGRTLASSVTPNIVKVTDAGAVEKINFAELATLSRTNKVDYSTMTNKYVDTIVVTTTAGGSDAYTAAKTELDGFAPAAVTLSENVSTDAAAKAAIKSALESQLAATTPAITGCTVVVTTVAPTPTTAGEALTADFTLTKGDYTRTIAGLTVTNPADAAHAAATAAAATAQLTLPSASGAAGAAATGETSGYTYGYAIVAVGTPSGTAPTATIAAADGKITVTEATGTPAAAAFNTYTITVTATKNGISGTSTWTLRVKNNDTPAYAVAASSLLQN